MRLMIRTTAGTHTVQCDGFGTNQDGTFVAGYGELVMSEVNPGALLGVDVLAAPDMERRAVQSTEPAPVLTTGPIQIVEEPMPADIHDPAETQTVTLAGPTADDAFAGRDDRGSWSLRRTLTAGLASAVLALGGLFAGAVVNDGPSDTEAAACKYVRQELNSSRTAVRSVYLCSAKLKTYLSYGGWVYAPRGMRF